MPAQLVQQVDPGNLRPVAMEDDDVGIAGGIRCAEQRGDRPDRKAPIGQLVGQESAIDRAVLDEKDAKIASGSLTGASGTGAPASKLATSSKTVAI